MAGAAAAAAAAEASATSRQRRVQLVITPIGPWLPLKRLQAYHSSILIDDFEYSFGICGIVVAQGAQSHEYFPRSPAETQIVDMGTTQRSAKEMYKKLRPYFRKNSYDLLRKNCNSFSDCVLCYLSNARLPKAYRTLERMGKSADKRSGFVRAISWGQYMPNPQADSFLAKSVRSSLLASPSK
mmetsp:Transcript_176712/g.566710  ORF Transcript_176712/g.566710 Transcript_176712/m.566710 type:complete len:183 (+) Transcript_176712:428-976(+)